MAYFEIVSFHPSGESKEIKTKGKYSRSSGGIRTHVPSKLKSTVICVTRYEFEILINGDELN